jgi:hypothetical protein
MRKNQNKILENFIAEFLPPIGTKRKYSGNELDYITTTLDKVFIQNFSFNLSKSQIADCFSRLNYEIFDKHGIYNSITKKIKPTALEEVNILEPQQFTYFNIKPKSLRQLMLTTSQLSIITNSKKIDDTEKMKSKIEKFKKTLYSTKTEIK